MWNQWSHTQLVLKTNSQNVRSLQIKQNGIFSARRVCSHSHLSVCRQEFTKTNEPAFLKLGEKMGYEPRKTPLSLGETPDKGVDRYLFLRYLNKIRSFLALSACYHENWKVQYKYSVCVYHAFIEKRTHYFNVLRFWLIQNQLINSEWSPGIWNERFTW